MTTEKLMGLSFPMAVAALLECGAHIRRAGWRNKFHLELEDYSIYESAVIVRVADDSTFRNPWGVVTEDDSQSMDWEIIESTAATEVPDDFQPKIGTYAYAFQALLLGANAIRMSVGWHPLMKVFLVDGQIKIAKKVLDMGKVMVMVTKDGSFKYYRPAPQDLAGAWSVIEAA